MVKVGLIVALHADAYLEPSSTSMIEFLAKIAPLRMFGRF